MNLWIKSWSVTVQMKASKQYFPVALFIILYKVFLTFQSVDEIIKCDHSNVSSLWVWRPVWSLIICSIWLFKRVKATKERFLSALSIFYKNKTFFAILNLARTQEVKFRCLSTHMYFRLLQWGQGQSNSLTLLIYLSIFATFCCLTIVYHYSNETCSCSFWMELQKLTHFRAV